MGMDVFGKSPTKKAGEYFRNNVWWWHPLWTYCERLMPSPCSEISGHMNDGEGLSDEDAIKLADILQNEVDNGNCAIYQHSRQAQLDNTPDEPCSICKGTGERDDQFKGVCNGCQGKGTRRPFDTNYNFTVENVEEFINFLRHCGGFEIC